MATAVFIFLIHPRPPWTSFLVFLLDDAYAGFKLARIALLAYENGHLPSRAKLNDAWFISGVPFLSFFFEIKSFSRQN